MNSIAIGFHRRSASRKGVLSMLKMTFKSPMPLDTRTKSPSNSVLKPLNANAFKRQCSLKKPLIQNTKSLKNTKNPVSASPQEKPIRKNLLLDETIAPGDPTDYTITKTIGQGTYGLVKEAFRNSDRQKVAIKIYDKYKIMNPVLRERLLNEIKTLKSLNHEHIVKLYDVIETHSYIYLVLEHVAGMSLYKYCQSRHENRLNESETRLLFLQMAKAIEHCHSNNISHRDLKLDNILIDKNHNIKIIDFGFASENKAKVLCGTPHYIAPEILNKRESYGPAVDVWALGIILYVMLTGIHPFRASNDDDLYHKILCGNYVTPPWVSSVAKKLIAKMIEVDPSRRISSYAAARHPWCKPPRSLDVSNLESDSPDQVKGSFSSGTVNASVNLGRKKVVRNFKRTKTIDYKKINPF